MRKRDRETAVTPGAGRIVARQRSGPPPFSSFLLLSSCLSFAVLLSVSQSRSFFHTPTFAASQPPRFRRAFPPHLFQSALFPLLPLFSRVATWHISRGFSSLETPEAPSDRKPHVAVFLFAPANAREISGILSPVKSNGIFYFSGYELGGF